MYKCLIVDDEEIERKSLHKMINQHIDSISIIGEASSGSQAVALAKAHQPDIILLDIKMPGMDGISTLKEMKKLGLAAKFIIISAYDTFDYAREVMKEGVKEYLLKPARIDETVQTIKRVINELESEKTNEQSQTELKERYNKVLPFVQSEWVASLLLDHVQEMSMVELGAAIDVTLANNYAVAFQLNTNEVHKIEQYQWIKKELRKRCQGLAGPLTGNQIPAFIPVQTELEGVPSSRLQQITSIVQSFSEFFPGVSICAGIGGLAYHVNHFFGSYQEALKALKHTTINKPVRLFHAEMDKDDFHDHTLFKTEQRLFEMVRQGEFDQALGVFDQYVNKLKVMTKGDTAQVQKGVEELFDVLITLLKELGIQIKNPFSLNSYRTSQHLKETAKMALQKIFDQITSWQDIGSKRSIIEAKKYIETHYMRPITLEETAQHVSLSPYYFSKLFKDHFKVTFIEYLTLVRLKRAKELLLYSKLSLKEITYQVGYKDPNYFSRVFKKAEKLSPKSYRIQNYQKQKTRY
ncbi:response regulator [Scopulibacillus cellulosilyticus]|uniref:Response regulator n=1 Tax=Scopulibacillus cellulosilyticus TaxID=2665665 RepID=A0ABW2PYU6_9BACL